MPLGRSKSHLQFLTTKTSISLLFDGAASLQHALRSRSCDLFTERLQRPCFSGVGTSLWRRSVSGFYEQPGGCIFNFLHQTAVEASSARADVRNTQTEMSHAISVTILAPSTLTRLLTTGSNCVAETAIEQISFH